MSGTSSTAKRGLLPRFLKSEKGVTAIEFAMVGGPFLYLLLVIMETAAMLFSEYIIENGVAQAARQIRTGQVQIAGKSKQQFKDLVCAQLPAYLNCAVKLNIDVRKFTTFASVVLPTPLDSTGNLSASVSSASVFTPGGPLEVVVVRTYYLWDLAVPGLSMLSNMGSDKRLLTSGSAFRNEPYTP